jgi:hypothetical protein
MFFRRGLAAIAVMAACSSSGSGNLNLAPTIIVPEGLLDGVTTLTVSVYDPGSSLSCNTMNGTVNGLSANQMPLATSNMTNQGCATGVTFCGTLSVNESSSPRLFTAQAFVGSASSPVASGCTLATPNQSTIQVTIKMLRTLPPSTCNMMPSAMITQCATGSTSDPVCDQNCQSIEEYFSPTDSSTTNDTKSKVRPMLAWPSGMGAPGVLVGAWGEVAAGGNQVSMRLLNDSMEPYTGASMCIQSSSFRMPSIMSEAPCPGQLYAKPQFNPTVAAVNGNYYVAFEDGSSGATAINIRSFDPNLTPQQANAVGVSNFPGVAQAAPSMAANGNTLYVAWENQGTIFGNTVTVPALTVGTQQSLGAGTLANVAATSTGWVVAFQNASDVDMVTVSSSGTAGAPAKVNTASGASHPGIAAFGGNVAVVWADGSGSIRAQRYNGTTPIANDQANALQDPSLTSMQSAPSVAAGTNFFVATWVDGTSGHIRARFLDGMGGYMFNFVNGQSSDFQVSTLNGETRNNPIAVSGGNTMTGPFVAIAWEDNTGAPSSFKGIWGRRFPLPQ